MLICLLTNLVDNARKAGATRIIVEFLQNKISVADNGCGIPAEKIPELTEPFFKLDSSRNTEGFGLGLTLAARIAQLHHARLIFKSEVGRGTTVSLTF